jgi:pyridoxine/pyridoxamine 5'-phosphate oxidase
MTEADLYSFLSQCRLGVLGSISNTGAPQAALVGIAVTPRLEIIFDTVKSSRKYPNLISTPACSFVIGWNGEQTVQYEGRAEELEPPDLESYGNLFQSVA